MSYPLPKSMRDGTDECNVAGLNLLDHLSPLDPRRHWALLCQVGYRIYSINLVSILGNGSDVCCVKMCSFFCNTW